MSCFRLGWVTCSRISEQNIVVCFGTVPAPARYTDVGNLGTWPGMTGWDGTEWAGMQNGTERVKVGHWVLTRLFRGCHELETLSLARCHRVGDEELKELGVGCRGLVRLDLKDCSQVLLNGVQ